MGLKQRAKRLKRDIPAVFLALKHKKTPVIAKIFAAVTVGYALSPIDLIPDFIPVLGYLDDLILLPMCCPSAVRKVRICGRTASRRSGTMPFRLCCCGC